MMWDNYGEGPGQQMSQKFKFLQSKFSRLLNGRSEGDRQTIHGLFDAFNALDFRTTIISNSAAAVLLINQCCTIVPPTDTFLVAKGCQLISNLVMKQNVKVEGKTLAVTLDWIVQSLKYSADIAVLDILLALEAILRGNGRNTEIENHERDLLGPNSTLISFLSPVKSNELKLALPWEVHLAALKCLEAVTFTEPEQKQTDGKCPFLQPCLEIFLGQFELEPCAEQEEANCCKIVTTAMKGVQNVVQQSESLPADLTGDLLGVIKAFMLYGLPGHAGLKPQRVFPASAGAGASGQAEIRATSERAACKGSKNVRIKKAKTSRVRKKAESRSISPDGGVAPQGAGRFRALGAWPGAGAGPAPWLSESDASDGEGGQAAANRSQQTRVRHASIVLLHSIVKMTDRRAMFGYWSSLLPSGPSSPATRTLATCLLRDPSARSRAAVLAVITLMLLGSRVFLQQAEAPKATSAFTPFSVSLGYMVVELHRTLCLALTAEHSPAVVVPALKCLAALAQNTPYHRLAPGPVARLVRAVRPGLRHKDSTVHVAALTVLGSIASVEPPTEEIIEQLSKPAAFRPAAVIARSENPTLDSPGPASPPALSEFVEEDDLDDRDDLVEVEGGPAGGSGEDISWLLEHCLGNLIDVSAGVSRPRHPQLPVPVKLESLQVLAVLSQYFFAAVIAPRLAQLVSALSLVSSAEDLVLRRHAGHVVEGVGLSIQQALATPSAGAAPIALPAALAFWRGMLAGPVLALLQHPTDASLRTVGCDCLGSIGLDVFQELTRDKQILIVTVLFGCCRDNEHNTRQSAVRALAMCIQFPSLREDATFVSDTAEAVMRLLKDVSLVVRVKAAWSLGNLSDALVHNAKAGMEDVPRDLLLRLLQASVTASQDNDKVRCNSVRSVGNLLLLCSAELAALPDFGPPIDAAIGVLVKNATSGNNMKCRWNSCYAISNMLKNPVLYAANPANMTSVFHALTRLVINFRNFKVRINAALALATPASREMYGRDFVSVWDGLMAGLENAQHTDELNEFCHQDSLINQLCLTLIHVMTLVSAEDLSPLLEGLTLHAETLSSQLVRFHRSVVPEREGALPAAAHRALTLSRLPALTAEQRQAAETLVHIFTPPCDAD